MKHKVRVGSWRSPFKRQSNSIEQWRTIVAALPEDHWHREGAEPAEENSQRTERGGMLNAGELIALAIAGVTVGASLLDWVRLRMRILPRDGDGKGRGGAHDSGVVAHADVQGRRQLGSLMPTARSRESGVTTLCTRPPLGWSSERGPGGTSDTNVVRHSRRGKRASVAGACWVSIAFVSATMANLGVARQAALPGHVEGGLGAAHEAVALGDADLPVLRLFALVEEEQALVPRAERSPSRPSALGRTARPPTLCPRARPPGGALPAVSPCRCCWGRAPRTAL